MAGRVTTKRCCYGLSLFEIIIVIAIISLLTGITFAFIGKSIGRSRTVPTCSMNLKQIALAYSMYESDNGALPRYGLVTASIENYVLSSIKQCPMTRRGYKDTYMSGVLNTRRTNRFPSGKPIPTFDPSRDILVRCLSHGYEGYDGYRSGIVVIEPSTKGQVLGARLDGSVSKVSPISCFEFGSFDLSTLRIYGPLIKTCDRHE